MSRTYEASLPSDDAAVRAQGDVVDDSHAVPESLGAAPLERLPDRRKAERLAGVDREMEVLVGDEVEGVEVPRRRVAGLRPGDVEPDHSLVTMANRHLGDLDRARGLAHGGDDQPDRDRSPLGASAEALEHGGDRFVERQAAIGQELGSHPDLGVDDAVGGKILDALRAHALDRVTRLHDGDGVTEPLEV